MDREKVIKGLNNISREIINTIGHGEAIPYLRTIDDALSLLKEQGAVDRNTGKWKNGHCSCCGEDVSSMLDTWTNVQNFLFCPICGAEMKGETKVEID